MAGHGVSITGEAIHWAAREGVAPRATFWIAAERLPQFQALWPGARLDPVIAARFALFNVKRDIAAEYRHYFCIGRQRSPQSMLAPHPGGKFLLANRFCLAFAFALVHALCRVTPATGATPVAVFPRGQDAGASCATWQDPSS